MEKTGPGWGSICEGPFMDHSKDTHPHEIAVDEARTILESWVKVATFNLPRKTVSEMLKYQASILLD